MDVSHAIWHASPGGAPASRRSVLLGLAVALFATGCAKHNVASVDAEPASDPVFLRLSQALTGHQDLDPVTAARLSAAFATIAPDVHARFSDLARLRAADPRGSGCRRSGLAPSSTSMSSSLSRACATSFFPVIRAAIPACTSGSVGGTPRTSYAHWRKPGDSLL